MDATEVKLQTHEELCTMRYDQIEIRLKRIETVMMNVAGLLLIGMGGIIFTTLWTK